MEEEIKAIEIQAPNSVCDKIKGYVDIFLAGSIENGSAEKWQSSVVSKLANEKIRFLNPRRDDWDPTWGEDTNNDELIEQIVWELTALEWADIIIMYFDPNTKSMISLLELGLHAKSDKLIVFCPKGYCKKANVDITCAFHNIIQVDSFEELFKEVKKLREIRFV